jgi:S-adenosyl-L-methionine hydrolase (adenosine-forming)
MNIRKKQLLAILSLVLFFTLLAGPLACTAPKTNLPVVLFSDFGTGDYRVSQLKGIILNQNAAARLIDASHSVPAFDVPTGAFLLDIAAREFPEGVIFVAVVDPYTSPQPRYLVLTTDKKQIFVLPDNGLLTYVARNMGIRSLYSVDNRQLFDQPVSELSAERLEGTVGGRLSSGYPVQDVGAPVKNQVTLDIQEPAVVNNRLLGTVIFVDNFGNCVTNIKEAIATQFGLAAGDIIEVYAAQNLVTARYGKIYSDVLEGKEIVFVNNNLGVIQLSINLGNYSKKYQLKAGEKIEIQKPGPAR